MITTIRYPALLRARPPRCSDIRDIVCSFPHVHDVPEISSSEVRRVTELGTVWPQMFVEYDGRLFRHIGHRNDDPQDRVFSIAFLKEIERDRPWRFSFEGGSRTDMPPLSQALNNILLHRLYMSGDGREKQEEAWPSLNDTRHYGPAVRDKYRFEDFEAKLTDVDGERLAAMREDHRIEAERLLVIDGAYWVETPPPVICVDVSGFGTTSRMDCDVTILPSWLDAKLGRQYFPLSEREDALEYARQANEITPGNGPVGDYIAESGAGDASDPMLWFDAEQYAQTRTVAVLGGDAARQITKYPELTEKLGHECARAVLEVRERALKIGSSITEWPDLTEYTEDVVAAWKGSGRKPGWAEISQDRRRFADLICQRAVDAASSRPISLGLARSFGR
jgi:hypothetical protein